MEDFVKKVLEDPNTFGRFKVTSYKQSSFEKPEKNIWYGEAQDRTGMTQIQWSTEGHSCTYFGENLELNISIGIKKDAGTRSAFNGYCFNEDDFRRVLKMTW